MLRLLLVDDYQMVTEALTSRLSAAPDLWVVGCARTDDVRLPDITRWLRPDVILIDIEPLGHASGEVLRRLGEAWAAARVIVLSAGLDPDRAVEAARAGAAAWVSKRQGADELEAVIRGVSQGHSWYPPELLGEVLRELREDIRRVRENDDPLAVLSPREREVLAGMVEGKRDRQVAEDLMITTDTVRTHTRKIFSKLDVHSRLEAVSVARDAGLLPERAAPGPAQPKAAPARPRRAQRK